MLSAEFSSAWSQFQSIQKVLPKYSKSTPQVLPEGGTALKFCPRSPPSFGRNVKEFTKYSPSTRKVLPKCSPRAAQPYNVVPGGILRLVAISKYSKSIPKYSKSTPSTPRKRQKYKTCPWNPSPFGRNSKVLQKCSPSTPRTRLQR